MKCSRIAAWLCLAVLSTANVVGATDDGQTDAAVDAVLNPLSYLDIPHQTELFESVTDYPGDEYGYEYRAPQGRYDDTEDTGTDANIESGESDSPSQPSANADDFTPTPEENEENGMPTAESQATDTPEPEADTETQADAMPEPEANAEAQPESDMGIHPDSSENPKDELDIERSSDSGESSEGDYTDDYEYSYPRQKYGYAEGNYETTAPDATSNQGDSSIDDDYSAWTAEQKAEVKASDTPEPEADIEAQASDTPEAEANTETQPSVTSEPEANTEAQPSVTPEPEANTEAQASVTPEPEVNAEAQPESDAGIHPDSSENPRDELDIERGSDSGESAEGDYTYDYEYSYPRQKYGYAEENYETTDPDATSNQGDSSTDDDYSGWTAEQKAEVGRLVVRIMGGWAVQSVDGFHTAYRYILRQIAP